MSDVLVPPLFNTVRGLGDPLGVYESDRQRIRNSHRYIVAAGLPFIALAFWLLLFYRELNPPLVWAFLVVVVVGMLYFVRRASVQWNDIIVLYTEGLAYFNGRTILLFKWDEIAAITVDMTGVDHGKVTAATVHSYTITHQNGKQLKVDTMILRSGELCDQVRQRILPHILARNRQTFSYGKLVRFGAVAMGKEQGILAGKQSLKWRDVGEFAIERRQVVVKPKKGRKLRPLSAEITGVVNLDVFLALAEEMAHEYG